MLKIQFVTLIRGKPPIPQKQRYTVTFMNHKEKINFGKKRKVRQHRVEVRLSDEELLQLKNANSSSIAKLLRESALNAVSNETVQKQYFSKLDRDFLLELSRIGNNLNQISRAINTDLASDRPIDAARLLHLLIGIDQAIGELRNDR